MGMLIIGNLSIASTFYPGKKASALLKINIGYTIAFIVGPLLVSLILYIRLDWRYYYIIHMVPLIILTFILWKIDIPHHIRVETSLKKLFSINKKIITNPTFILCGVIIFFYASMKNVFFVWFTTYFTSLNIDLGISSLFLSIYGIAIFIGILLRGKSIMHFNKRKTQFISFIICFFLLIGLLLIGNIIAKVVVVFLFGITITGNFAVTFSISSGLFPKFTNAASGLIVAFSNIGVMIFQFLSGYMSEHYSRNSILYINIFILFILIIASAFLSYHRKFSRA